MKTISFFKHNVEKIKAGLKTQTRRTSLNDLFPGDIVQIEEDKTVKLLIPRLSGGLLKDITDEDAIREGYPDSASFLKGDWAARELIKSGNPKVQVISFKEVE